MSNQAEILERLKQARNPGEDTVIDSTPSEDVEATPEEPETEDTIEAEAEEEYVEVEEDSEEYVDEDVDAPEADVTADLQDEDLDGDLYIDLDGDEVSLSEVREWKQGTLRQADYTRKTQELAEQRKEIESQQAEFQAKQQQLDNSIAELSVLIDEKDDAINWDELREYDPSEYLKQKELQEKRQAKLEEIKGQRNEANQAEMQARANQEVVRLAEVNGWMDGDKPTKKYKSDMDKVSTYLNSLQIPEVAQKGILTTGFGQVVLDAAAAHAAKKSKHVKKVKKAPVVTKPKGVRKPVATAELERAQKAHKKYGTQKTFMALRKAQRKVKGN